MFGQSQMQAARVKYPARHGMTLHELNSTPGHHQMTAITLVLLFPSHLPIHKCPTSVCCRHATFAFMTHPVWRAGTASDRPDV